MPELPDVEVMRRYLARHGLNRRIKAVIVKDRRILDRLSPATFAGRLAGARFIAVRRHGKHLFARTDKGFWLTFHFGMTGGLSYFRLPAENPPYSRVRIDFAGGGYLGYTNRRMLGRVGLVNDLEAFLRAERLGPDLLDSTFDLAAFLAAAMGARVSIKTALMDQTRMAGLGNIYVDEVLFQARLHPERPVATLSVLEKTSLYAATKRILKAAIAHGAGAEIRSEKIRSEKLPRYFLLSQRRKGGRCPRCRWALAKRKLGGRTTYYFACCQRHGGPVCSSSTKKQRHPAFRYQS